MALALLEGQLGAGTAHPAHHNPGGIGAACPVPRLLNRGGAQCLHQSLQPLPAPTCLPCLFSCPNTVTRICPLTFPSRSPWPRHGHAIHPAGPLLSWPQAGTPLTWRAWLAKPSPSCLQTTMASFRPHCAPHTAPHCSRPCTGTSTSTTPSSGLRPPASRTCWQRGAELECGAEPQLSHPELQWDKQPHTSS